MKWIWVGVAVGITAGQPSYAEMGCKAVQVTCVPEIGMADVRMLDYSDSDSCEHDDESLKNLHQKGIYPIPKQGVPLLESTCALEVGELKTAISSYVENANPQGECGAYGAVPAMNMWLDRKQLLKDVPIQTCRMHPGYDAQSVTFRDEGDTYSIMFGGDVSSTSNYYPFQTVTKSPEGFQLPITRWAVAGVSESSVSK